MRERGLTLIEMMIALLIGTLLLSTLVGTFLAQKANYMMQEGIGRVQENGRIAQYMLNADLRMTGLVGCNTVEAVTPSNYITAASATQTMTSSSLIQGYNGSGGSWTPAIPSWITNNLPTGTGILPNTDVITVQHLDNTTVGLTANMSSASSDITVPNQVNFVANNTLVISDCDTTDIFLATTGTTSTVIKHSALGNSSSSLSKAYQTDAVVGLLQTYTYYVRNSGRKNFTGMDIPVLVRQDGSGNELEIAEGVENLQLLYGVDTDGDHAADTFTTADVVSLGSQWGSVVNVQVSSLVNSVEQTSPNPQPYYFQGATVVPTDRLYRREWDSLITFRNRTI